MSEEAPPAEPPPAEGEGEAVVEPDFKPPCMDLSDFPVKADFFEVF